MANTHRQDVRDAQAARMKRAVDKGITVDNLRKEDRSVQGMAEQISTFTNESIPRAGNRQRSVIENPPFGAVDGSNTDFTLQDEVLFNDLQVVLVTQNGTTGVPNRLDRTTSPAPAGGRFFFDGISLVRLGDTPQPGDGLFVFYVTKR